MDSIIFGGKRLEPYHLIDLQQIQVVSNMHTEIHSKNIRIFLEYF